MKSDALIEGIANIVQQFLQDFQEVVRSLGDGRMSEVVIHYEDKLLN